MHIDVVPNRGARPAYLLRESFREGTRVRKRTIANLSALSDAQIEAIRAVLRGERLAPAAEQFEAIASRAHGHVAAVRVAMQRLEIANLVGTRPCRERDRVLAMVPQFQAEIPQGARTLRKPYASGELRTVVASKSLLQDA